MGDNCQHMSSWDNVAFYHAHAVTARFDPHLRMMSPLLVLCFQPGYGRSLLIVHITAEHWQAWMLHAKRYFPRCCRYQVWCEWKYVAKWWKPARLTVTEDYSKTDFLLSLTNFNLLIFCKMLQKPTTLHTFFLFKQLWLLIFVMLNDCKTGTNQGKNEEKLKKIFLVHVCLLL